MANVAGTLFPTLHNFFLALILSVYRKDDIPSALEDSLYFPLI